MFDLFSSDSSWGKFGNAFGDAVLKRNPNLNALYNFADSQGWTSDNAKQGDSNLAVRDPGSYKGIIGGLIPMYGALRGITEQHRQKVTNLLDDGTEKQDNPFEGLLANDSPTDNKPLIAPVGNVNSFMQKNNSNAGTIMGLVSSIL